MPSTSKKQERFMQAVANNPEFAKSAGVSQAVGREFATADKAKKERSMKKYAQGGIFREGMEVPQDIDMGSTRPKNTTGSKRRPAKKLAMGGEMKYAEGGKVRGAGMAKKGVKKCQMR